MKIYNHRNMNSIYNLHNYYKIEDADAEIANLKAENEKLKYLLTWASNTIHYEVDPFELKHLIDSIDTYLSEVKGNE